MSANNRAEVMACEICGTNFNPRTYHQVYCSAVCRRAQHYAKVERPEIQCKECGKTVPRRHTEQVFCGKVCRDVYWHREDSKKYAAVNNTPTPPTHCKQCGVAITKARSNQLYCSDMCSNVSNKKPKPHNVIKFKLCYYCGLLANSKEHVVPKMIRMCGPTIPACKECNSLIGSYLGSIDEKLVYAKRQLKKKYGKLLEYGTEDEKTHILARLAYIPDPLPDDFLRLCNFYVAD